MNKRLVANELVKIAKSLTAVEIDKKQKAFANLSELQKSYYEFFKIFLDWKKRHRTFMNFIRDRTELLNGISKFSIAINDVYNTLKLYKDQKENAELIKKILIDLDVVYEYFVDEMNDLKNSFYVSDEKIKSVLNNVDMELQKLKLF